MNPRLAQLLPMLCKPAEKNQFFAIDVGVHRGQFSKYLVNPIWYFFNAETDRKSKLKARIVEVELRAHSSFILKNKHDHIVTAVDSFNHKVDPPNLNPGDETIFELRINMLIASFSLC
jgi:hypothetical protein